ATIAGLLQDTIYVAQIGDSRGYIIRDGVGIQITKDQSLMQKLVEAGELTEEEAEHSERRNIILQALGPEASIKVDLTHQPLVRHRPFLLEDSGATMGIVNPGENETTQPIPVISPFGRPSQAPDDAATTMGEPAPAVAPFPAPANLQGGDTEAEEFDESDEDD